mmetsp:Transcript_16646/g.35207  ORF Transcript_16646/g.35207 Transcript_16646/m.35207 type:complete len:418 (-) Transcript_16646:98-1351(-)
MAEIGAAAEVEATRKRLASHSLANDTARQRCHTALGGDEPLDSDAEDEEYAGLSAYEAAQKARASLAKEEDEEAADDANAGRDKEELPSAEGPPAAEASQTGLTAPEAAPPAAASEAAPAASTGVASGIAPGAAPGTPLGHPFTFEPRSMEEATKKNTERIQILETGLRIANQRIASLQYVVNKLELQIASNIVVIHGKRSIPGREFHEIVRSGNLRDKIAQDEDVMSVTTGNYSNKLMLTLWSDQDKSAVAQRYRALFGRDHKLTASYSQPESDTIVKAPARRMFGMIMSHMSEIQMQMKGKLVVTTATMQRPEFVAEYDNQVWAAAFLKDDIMVVKFVAKWNVDGKIISSDRVASLFSDELENFWNYPYGLTTRRLAEKAILKRPESVPPPGEKGKGKGKKSGKGKGKTKGKGKS